MKTTQILLVSFCLAFFPAMTSAQTAFVSIELFGHQTGDADRTYVSTTFGAVVS